MKDNRNNNRPEYYEPKKQLNAVQKIIARYKAGTLGETISDWRWIFQYTKRYRWYVVIQTIFGILGSTMGLVSSILSKYLIDIITQKETDKLTILIISTVFSALFGLVFSSIQSRISTKISLRVFHDIRGEIFERLLDAEWQKVRAYPTGDIINRLNGDVNRISGIAISWIPSTIITIYSFVASFAAMLYYNVSIAFIALLGAPVLAISGWALLKKSRYYNMRMFECQSAVLSFESETFHNYDTVKSLGAVKEYTRYFWNRQDESKRTSLEANLFSISAKIFLSIVGMCITFATFGYCLFLLWSGSITYGTMTFFLSQRSKVTSGFNSLMGILPSMVQSAVSAKRVREFINIPSEQRNITDEEVKALSKPPITVRLKDVVFGYDDGRNVLNGCDFYAKTGEIVAIVGASGQGKTTMLRLLLSLVSPSSGSAEYVDANGEVHTLTADFRRLFSYVPQGNTVLSGTFADNLRLTNQGATDEQIKHALECSLALDFVEEMGGIYSKIGERGHGISEGQAQRISIARAILRDAPILMLDEATSSLDIETEQEIIHSIIKKNPEKTCIISTHRPSALSLADRIYRVEEGSIKEISFEEVVRMSEENA